MSNAATEKGHSTNADRGETGNAQMQPQSEPTVVFERIRPVKKSPKII